MTHWRTSRSDLWGRYEHPTGSPRGADTRADSETTLSAESVRRFLNYEPVTGALRWKELPPQCTRSIGSIAGSKMRRGYWKVTLFGVTYLAHRVAWLHFHGRWPAEYIDHIDGDPSNNAIKNLREANSMENARCCRAKGFYQDKRTGRFTAQIRVNKKSIHLGTFDTAEAASSVYFAATEKYFGEFSIVCSRGINHV